MKENDLLKIMKENTDKPLVLGFINSKGYPQVFAGTFKTQELPLLKELLVRQIDSMLDRVFKVDAEIEQEQVNKPDKVERENLNLPLENE